MQEGNTPKRGKCRFCCSAATCGQSVSFQICSFPAIQQLLVVNLGIRVRGFELVTGGQHGQA
ncbi:MAG: hypothetical protein V4573_11215, partial [Pseudomonadota bacterium]